MKRNLSLCLAAVLLSSAVISCGSAGNDTSDSTGSAVSATVTESTPVTEDPAAQLVTMDMGGRDFNIMTKMEWDPNGRWTAEDFSIEEADGDIVHDAIYNRNAKLEEMFNCHITNTFENMGGLFSYTMYQAVAKLMQAGDSTYDFIMPPIQDSAKLSCENMLLDLRQFDSVHLDEPWWNQVFESATRIGDATYYADGDISLTFMRAAYAIFFNKQSIETYDLENPYQLVSDKKWTIDKVMEMAKAASEDINGNGYMDSEDKIGMAMLYNSGEAFYAASGVKLVTVDDNGMLQWTGGSDKSIAVMNKIFDIYDAKNVTLNCDDATKMSGPYVELGNVFRGNNLFSAGQALFWFGTMNIVPALRDMETDFGILPLPMAFDTQDQYYSYVHTWSASAAVIPTTAKNPQETAAFMEAAAYYARDMITPAYYDTALKTKYARDEESQAMLDIIYKNRWSDLGNIFNVGGVLTQMTTYVTSGKNEFASMIEKRTKKIDKELAQINETLHSNQ